MKQIKYIPKFDFVFYTDTIANLDDKRNKTEKEIKNKTHITNKEMLKTTEAYFTEASEFFDQLSFMQKNTLNLFFHKIDIISDYLIFLMHSDETFDNINISTFKSFLTKMCECDAGEIPENYEEVHHFVKDHYDTPDSFVDFEKTTNLIIDVLKEPSILDNLHESVDNLYETFYDLKIQPMIGTINEIVNRHQEIYNQSPKNFIAALTNGKINKAEVDTEEMDAILTYYAPFTLYISISFQKYIYGVNLEKLATEEDVTDLYQPLLKFLSDTKRYEMIKRLSEKKWYSNELAKEFCITPATMSYHMNKLYGLGLIHLEQGDQNRLYMELDKKKLKDLLSKIQEDLLK